jgi:UDP-N-acetylmuramyl pentapeptide phosphotransferase/UDP-N-acetylglucosamine-1-phosphate transferase
VKIAKKYAIIDKPNHRSSHTTPTIRGGGILFLVAVWIFFFMSGFEYPLFCLGVTLIGIVSYIDDLVTLSSKIRLPFQLVAVVLVLAQLEMLSFGIGLYIFVVIGSVLFINIYNFMDGVNGITGLYSLTVLSGILLVNHNEQIINNDLIMYSLMSLLVFGFYNFRKNARFFAGDVGSISIAMVLLFCILFLIIALESPILLLLVVVYGVDSLITLLYRIFIKENILAPHRHHIYQKLVDTFKLSHLKVSLFYCLIQFVVNIVVYYNYKKEVKYQYLVVCIITLFLIILYRVIFKKNEKLKVEEK